jgi:hypothetical protein
VPAATTSEFRSTLVESDANGIPTIDPRDRSA